MSDLKTLVENYFAPKPKTLTKQMLYEIFDEVLREQEDQLNTVIDFLRSNGYEEAEEKSRTRNRLTITNMGGKVSRDKAITKLKKEFGLEPTKKYSRDPSKFIGGKLPDELGGMEIVLAHGATPLKQEEGALTDLQNNLKELSKEFKPDDTLRIAFTGPGFSKIYDVLPSAVNVPKTPKADFVIGSGDDKIFISHKAGVEPKDFGQWSGITEKAGGVIHNDPEVVEFGEIINQIHSDLKLSQYPSGIDIQKEIKSPKLMLQAVFGKDYGAGKSSADNVDFVIQGDVLLKPLVNPKTDELTGAFEIKGNKIFSKAHAEEDINSLKRLFAGGYFPRIAVRKGDSGRNSFDISSARGSIQSEAGRKVNFLLSPDSTPENINFIPLELDGGQLKNVKNLFKKLEDEGKIDDSNIELFNKMKDSVINLEEE